MVHFLGNQKGFSLIEVIFAAGLMVASIAAVLSTISYADTRLKASRQGLETLELKQTALRVVSDVSKCSAQLFVGKKIDVTGATGNVPAPNGRLELDSIFDGLNPTFGILAEKDKLLAGSPTGLTVSTIELRNVMVNRPGIEYRGNLVISFKRSSTIMNIRPVEIAVAFIAGASDPDNAKTILACATSNSGSAIGPSQIANFNCPSNMAVSGFDSSGQPVCSSVVGGTISQPPPTGPTTTWKLSQAYCAGSDNTKDVQGTLYSSCSSTGAYWTYCRPPLTGECNGVPGANFYCAVAICQ